MFCRRKKCRDIFEEMLLEVLVKIPSTRKQQRLESEDFSVTLSRGEIMHECTASDNASVDKRNDDSDGTRLGACFHVFEQVYLHEIR